ncbi:MAG: uroporphyrinogen decarboxylase family protein [Planctomycetota bacterium]
MAYAGVVDDLRACTEFRKPSRIPVFALGLEFDLHVGGVTCGESRTNVEKTVRCTAEMVERFDYDWAVVFPDDYIEFEPLGLRMNEDENLPTMPKEYLAFARGTLRRLRIPDAEREMRLPIQLEMIRSVRAALGDSVCVVGRIAAPFSSIALVYGVEATLIGMLEAQELIRENLEFFVEHQSAFGQAQIEAGADVLWLGDCVAGSRFISAEQYAKFAFEPAARVAENMAKAGGMVIYHTAETSAEHVRLQAELPVDAVNLGEGVSIAEMKARLAVRRCLMGNFDPMLLRDGSADAVAEATERMMRENARGGGYVFNTGEGIMVGTPEKNVEAMMATAKRLAGQVQDGT